MLERILKTLLIVMLMVLITQHVVQPAMEEAFTARQKLANVRAALQHMTTNDPQKVHAFLQTENKMIQGYLQEINRVLPDYQTTRVGAIGSLESLREKYQGQWQIQPSTQPVIDQNIVKWPVRLGYEGDFSSAVKVLESIEREVTLNRIVSVDFNAGKTAETELLVNLELLFSNATASSDLQAQAPGIMGGKI